MVCTCGQVPHRWACALEVAKRAPAEERLAYALARELRLATRQKLWRSEAHALGWFFKTREAWGSAVGLAVLPEFQGTGAPSRGADDPKRRAFAAVAYAVKLACVDAEERNAGDGARVARWVFEHHAKGRAYAWIAEERGDSLDQMKRRMSRVHRLVRERLTAGGFIEP